MIEVCGGFDGSDVDDWTAIRLETREGFQFTPTYGPDDRPTIWNPAEWNGRVPRSEVHAAWETISKTYRLVRVYLDPFRWQTEIEEWASLYGDEVFLSWNTARVTPMHDALTRFETDLVTGAITHDGCPLTATAISNARKIPKPGDRYVLGKPSQAQKIDPAMASVICHEAAADARADGWGEEVDRRMFVFR